MKIIEELEETKEDYTVEQWVILPDGDFDFNVSFEVYCTIKENKYISFRWEALSPLYLFLKRI
jgi:hypothetical protein